jgi:hypothetical protein
MKTEMYISLEHVILPCTAPADMAINTISMLQIISMIQSLLLGFGLAVRRRPKLTEF